MLILGESAPGGVGEYLQHWWLGDAARFYDARWCSLDQANKVVKIGQLAVGLLALFEVLSFSQAMSKLRGVTLITARAYFFWHLTLSVPRFLLTLGITILFVASGMLVWPGFRQLFKYHTQSSAETADSKAQQFLLVQLFSWLQQHPVPDRYIKSATFIAFVVLSTAEILTDI
jgi:hypothetical protein